MSTVTVSLRKEGLEPPVLIAGTFSEPQWELQEMQAVTDESGTHHFAAQLPVEAGRDYFYRFKAGQPPLWFLDQHAITSQDQTGTLCNVLKVPITSSTSDSARTPLVEATDWEGGYFGANDQTGIVTSAPRSLLSGVRRDDVGEQDPRSRTPTKQIAEVAAEVADTAAELDNPDSQSLPLALPPHRATGDRSVEKQLQTPLFAHESFGAHDSVDDGLDHVDIAMNAKSPKSIMSDSSCSIDDLSLGDARLENFPSDKSLVLDTLRQIRLSTDDDRPSSDDGQAMTSRGTGIESAEDSDFTLSPKSTAKRENRPSRSSFGRPRSAVSLTCIDEEPKLGDTAVPPDGQDGIRKDFIGAGKAGGTD